MAILQLAAASNPVGFMQQQQDAIVFVKQEVLEIVGYTSTVWVQPPPPSTTAEVETPKIETLVSTPEPVIVVPTEPPVAPAVPVASSTLEPEPEMTPELSLKPEPTPTPAPEPESVQGASSTGGGSGGYSGKATFYDAGLGSCGETHANSDMICALSKSTMSLTGGPNPNLNPMCGQMIRVKSASNPAGVKIKVVDTCPGCHGPYDLDLSPAAFDLLGSQLDGVIDVTWEYI
ncbi:hypothetical protein DRE_05085 [Drechslerella stenobrocha 248]|uniref:Uncharacterized protein n=1 Tax=Drechslerella stenobrocha 248 TaxID=1043628 RepID=W7I0J7_9PEZI|nr:hypothetical protein DRE_05085 [Drechslerella stenobrocha 248]